MTHARRHAVLAVFAACLLFPGCGTVQLHIVNITFVGRFKNYDGNDLLTYRGDLQNDSTTDLDGAWAQISGSLPAGATLSDGILLFGPTASSSTSTSVDFFSVVVAPGGTFDPSVLNWSIHPGLRDVDLDGLPDGEELDGLGTDPDNPDTDGDGVADGIELVMGTDPTSAQRAPTAFPDDVFFSGAPRSNGKTAIALSGSTFSLPGAMTRVGPGSSGPIGVAFDRHGFLYAARGGDIAHVDALSGRLLGTVPLHDHLGNPMQATEFAYDPTTDTFIAVKNDPTTGAPTTQPLQVDVRTGLAIELNGWLPGTPRAITILPQIDSIQGRRWLYAVIEDSYGTQQIYKVDLDSFSASPVGNPLTAPVTGLAFDQHLNLLQASTLSNGQTEVLGGVPGGGPYDAPLSGLAVPQPCPAPCFAPPVYRGVSAHAIAVGDVDGDGDPDVVTAGDYPQGLDWYANDGSGNFTAQPATTTADAVYSVALADFDGDGHLDAALVGGSDEVYVARGHGTGAFDPPVSLLNWGWPPIQAGDVTGDGAPDIVDSQFVLVNDGTGAFMPYQSAFGRPNTVAIATLEAGPVRQVVALYGDGGNVPDEIATFAWNPALMRFVETGRQALDFVPMHLAAGDFNGDGFDDVVVTGNELANGNGAAATLLGAGDGTLQAPVRLGSVPTFLSYTNPSVADVTGDGRADIVIPSCTDPQKGARVLVGDGAGHFQASLFDPSIGSDCSGNLVAADLDGDGLADLVGSYSLVSMLQLPVYPVK